MRAVRQYPHTVAWVAFMAVAVTVALIVIAILSWTLTA